jgi:hypothetical protein
LRKEEKDSRGFPPRDSDVFALGLPRPPGLKLSTQLRVAAIWARVNKVVFMAFVLEI